MHDNNSTTVDARDFGSIPFGIVDGLFGYQVHADGHRRFELEPRLALTVAVQEFDICDAHTAVAGALVALSGPTLVFALNAVSFAGIGSAFGGGGHARAAGCTVIAPLDAAWEAGITAFQTG